MSVTPARTHHLIVSGLSRRGVRGRIKFGHMLIPCALGKGGRKGRKREGDGATPLGRYQLLEVYYRQDAVRRPRTCLPVRAIGPGDGWCDEVADRNYNRRVRLPYPASHERMWREDRLYDLVVVLDYNLRRRRRGAGSAIFMHVAREGYLPTEGCIAVSARHLALLLLRMRPGDKVVIA